MNQRAFAALTVLSLGVTAAPSAHAATTVTRMATTTLNVRSGASTVSVKVGSLTSGMTVTGTIAGSWLHITSGKFSGDYVSTQYLSTPPPANFDDSKRTVPAGGKVGYVMADPSTYGSLVNVRSGMSFSASIVGHYGAHARVVGTPQGNGTWWKVANGYINSAVLETSTSNPSSLNARIPLSGLCLIPAQFYSHNGTAIGYGYTEKTPRYLQCKALPNLINLEAAYKAHFGAYAGIDNAYRTYAEQAYWYKLLSPSGSPVSKPGESNHGYGLAIDFQANYPSAHFSMFKKGQPGYNWMIANSGRFGFNNPYQFSPIHDDVHWNFVG